MFGANNYLPIFSQQLLTAHQGHHHRRKLTRGTQTRGKMVKAGRNGRQKNCTPLVALKFDSPSVLKLEKDPSRLWRGGRQHNHGGLLLPNIGHVWSGQLYQGTWHNTDLQVTFYICHSLQGRDGGGDKVPCKIFSLCVCVCLARSDLPGIYLTYIYIAEVILPEF